MTREGLKRITAEIAHEKAAALGRAGERLGLRLGNPAEPEERARVAGRYERARARAQDARLALSVQREAVGLRQHRLVDQLFPEPPRALR